MAAYMSKTILPVAHVRPNERPFLMIMKPWNGEVRMSRFSGKTGDRNMILGRGASRRQQCASSFLETATVGASTISELKGSSLVLGELNVLGSEEGSETAANVVRGMLVGDIDPVTAKIAISILGPILSAFSFLFIIRIVMSWYPKLPVDKFPYVVAYAPTEPILVVTRKVIPPLGGVDVTPVVWFGLLSFANEILVGPQGLLVLLSQKV